MLIDETGNRYGRWSVLHRTNGNYPGVFWRCKCDCGNHRIVPGRRLRLGQSNSCGCLRREIARNRTGPKHPSWKGGRRRTEGYILISKPEHANANGRGMILEHRFVMSEHLKRPLTKDETVHHRHPPKDDNRLKNLQLWSGVHPKGYAVEDLIPYAIEILKLYAPDKLR